MTSLGSLNLWKHLRSTSECLAHMTFALFIACYSVACDSRWYPNTHPEGQLYFSSPRKDGQHLYLTEEHLYDRKNVNEIERAIEALEKRLDQFGHKLSSEIEIFIAFDEFDEEGWYYYCVDTARRCLFWIDKVDLTWMAEIVGSVPSKAHLSEFILFYKLVFD